MKWFAYLERAPMEMRKRMSGTVDQLSELPQVSYSVHVSYDPVTSFVSL